MDFGKIRNYLFLGILLSVSLLLGYLFRPFAYPIFWAAVIAALFNPFYLGLNRYFKSPNLSSLITLIVVMIIIVLPLTVLSALVINESVHLYSTINDNRGYLVETVRKVADYLRDNPHLSRFNINEDMIVDRVSEISNTVVSFAFNAIKQLTQNSVVFIVMFVIMLYTLFYFLRDGEKMLKKLMFLLPLGNKYEMLLYKKFTSTARAAIKGTLVIGLMQGILGAILLAVVGVPGAFIWGIIMVILSIIPATSSTIVLIPAGIIMLVLGHFGAALTLIIGGGLISVLDNFIRPLLVGNDLQMHPLIILFSTLGGIALFGISGFIIGPIVAALFQSFWQMYEHYYQEELEND